MYTVTKQKFNKSRIYLIRVLHIDIKKNKLNNICKAHEFRNVP